MGQKGASNELPCFQKRITGVLKSLATTKVPGKSLKTFTKTESRTPVEAPERHDQCEYKDTTSSHHFCAGKGQSTND